MTKDKNLMSIDEMKDRLQKHEDLLRFSHLVSSSLNFKNIQRKASNKIKKIINCERVIIYRINEETGNLFCHDLFDGKADHDIYNFSIDENSYSGSCAKFGATINVVDCANDLRTKRDPKFVQKMNPKNMLLTPLINKGEVFGVIQAINSKNGQFSEEDVYFLEAVEIQLTSALENSLLYDRLKSQFVQVCEALGDAIVKKDNYTGGHTKRVGIFAEMIAKELDLTFDELDDVRLAAVLHDIGKIGIEDKILKKAAPLTEEEFQVMKQHPALGYEILGHIDSLKTVVDGMRFHHERPDGKGYPYGLKGEEIPLIAMIISVADTFDAMISTRPYRKGLPPMVAYKEILDNCGTQFSERVVEAFKIGFKKTKMYRIELDEELKKAS